jgi:DegV family protein with EDD domain
MLVVTDGAVDVPAALEGSAVLRRVAGGVWLGEEAFVGDADEFWAQLRKGSYPSTTPPTVSELMAAYRHPDLVIAVHVSGQLSATVARAKEAADRVGPGVVVVDSRSLSVGAGLIVSAVHCSAVKLGPSQSLVELARSLPDRLHTFALVQEVESVRRSDRASLLPATHLARNLPLVLAVRGRVVPLGQPKHRRGAIDDLARHVRDSTQGALGSWALGHGDAADIGAVADRLSEALGQTPRYCTTLDPAVGAHLGPESLVVGAVTDAVDLGV